MEVDLEMTELEEDGEEGEIAVEEGSSRRLEARRGCETEGSESGTMTTSGTRFAWRLSPRRGRRLLRGLGSGD